MKVNKIMFFCLIMCNALLGNAQDAECGLDFSEADVKALLLYHNNKPKTESDAIRYFPIKYHIVRMSDGTGGLASSSITQIEEKLNELYLGANIQFYTCESIEFIDSDTYYNFSISQEYSLRSSHNNNDCINIYFFNTVAASSGSVAGYSYLPTSNINFIAIKNQYATNGSTVAHELGHFFGLLHTHDTRYGNELVNGTNCFNAGDLFCDTPADPTLSEYVVNNSCVYIGNAIDLNGDYYNPDAHNLMSYSRKNCRTSFTPEQLAEISYWGNSSVRQFFINTTNLNNLTITTDATYSDDVIKVNTVSVENNANVIFDACKTTIIKKDFETELGTTIEIR